MARLLVHVEGPTEEDFVNQVLRLYLVGRGYHSVDARIIGSGRFRDQRGGIRPWPNVRRDIARHLAQDRSCIVTTMVDYYALPAHGPGAWLGRSHATPLRSASEKALCVEEALRNDLEDAVRFVPFVVMHEFEGLLFSDCGAFSRGIGRGDLEGQFQAIRSQFATPEEINDSLLTAPSKRIAALFPRYQKRQSGVLAAIAIGLDKIRAECPHFNDWLIRLEQLV